MLDTPPDLTAEDVAWCVGHYWDIEPADTTYAPVGHGSYNWVVTAVDGTKWFVKADPMWGALFLRDAYRTAAILHDRGLEFVHAATRDRSGELRRAVSPDWEIAVFPFIEGRNPDFHGPERALIAEAVGRLHAYPIEPDLAMRWEPGYRQPELHELIANDLNRPWRDGPYGERTRALIAGCVPGIQKLQALHDSLVDRLYASDEPWVVNQGEPHGGNTMLDAEGTIRLIDNVMLLAPRELDLRLLLHVSHQRALDVDNTEVLAAYRRGTGRRVEPREYVMEMYRAEWYLREISGYSIYFRDEHQDSEGAASRWKYLNVYAPVEHNWPELR
ncbi:aminoglycoside phosphotransferase/kinase family protein [Flindersiella endophytica]